MANAMHIFACPRMQSARVLRRFLLLFVCLQLAISEAVLASDIYKPTQNADTARIERQDATGVKPGNGVYHAYLRTEASVQQSRGLQGARDNPFEPQNRAHTGRALLDYPIDALSVVGILHVQDNASLSTKKDTVIISDPEGRLYFLHPGDILGKAHARIIHILDKEIVLVWLGFVQTKYLVMGGG